MATNYSIMGGDSGGGAPMFPEPSLSNSSSSGGSMLPWIVPAIAAVAGAVGQAVGGGSKTSAGFTLTPEQEIPFLKQWQTQLDQMQADYTRMNDAYTAYETKLSALDSIIGGGDKQEGLRALQESNFRIAGALGMSTEDLVKNNFISSEDKADLEKISSGQGVDPQQEQQIKNDRGRLEQDLRRSGQSPAVIAQSLQQFDQAAKEARFQRGWELVQAKGAIRQQGFGQTMNAFGATTGFAGQALSALSGTAGNRFNALQQTLKTQADLRNEGMDAYKTMGSFKLSKNTKQLLAGGAIGPGSVKQQTGIARGSTGQYWSNVNRQETQGNRPWETPNTRPMGRTPEEFAAYQEQLRQDYLRAGQTTAAAPVRRG